MTPMFEQYHRLKEAHPGAILFFRMGDFYEVFFEDAELCSRELELALTARNKNDEHPIPMAGVPHHAAAGYVQRLTDAGYRVAIAEQVEDPALAKGLVRREVVRIATPGVVLDPSSLEAREPNYMFAALPAGDELDLAFLDLSTGDFQTTRVSGPVHAAPEIHRFEPKEAILHPDIAQRPELRAALHRHRCLVTDIAPDAWVGVAGAAQALRAYAGSLSGGQLANVQAVRTYSPAGFMVIDDTTRRNLEVSRTLLGGRRQGTLIAILDRCGTAMGSRALKQWLAFPLLDREAITRRQAAIEALLQQPEALDALRRSLREVADIERILARVAQGSAHARDLAGLRRSLSVVPEIATISASMPDLPGPTDLVEEVATDLDHTLVDDPPLSLSEGGLIQRGVNAELDALIDIAQHGVGAITALEEREREATGISSLKIRNNRVFGYYIEITKANLHRVPKERYRRKQTLSTGERFITDELKEFEERVLGADERRQRLEYALFCDLRDRVAAQIPRLLELAHRLAEIDVLAALSESAQRWSWTRPTIVDDPIIDLIGARHPVVEASLTDERFIPNDCRLDPVERRLIILTGPNMSGKSTVMRQVALCCLLGHIGSFIPADRATIGVCDRIFTRVGAADDLARGQSTFMVEMSETAAILHAATDRSLVILDEIGRGTSTYDGLAIAWAVAEDLAQRIGCRALFATHYHELCALAESEPGVVNQSIAVSEWGDDIIFLRTLREGGASRSYGIQCARLAGIPDATLQRAKTLLARLETVALRNDHDQLSLFGERSTVSRPAPPPTPDPVRLAVEQIDPDAMTPREALDALYRLRQLTQGA